MIIARKLLLPMLSFFALALIGMAIVFYANFQTNLAEQDQIELQRFSQAFKKQLENSGELASALAQQTAGYVGIQTAITSQDLANAATLCIQPLEQIKVKYPDAVLQFHLPPANYWLKCQPNIYAGTLDSTTFFLATGTDQSTWRPSISEVMAEKTSISGLELAPDGLFVRGFVPAIGSDNSTVVGSIEVALPLDKTFIAALKSAYGGDWNILLSRAIIQNVNFQASSSAPKDAVQGAFQAAFATGPVDELVLHATTYSDTIYGLSQAYRQALQGQASPSQVVRSGINYTVISLPLRDVAGEIIGVVDVITDRTAALAALRGRMTNILGVGLFVLVLGAAGMTFILRRLLKPIQELTLTTAAIAQGDLSRPIPVPTGLADDEIKQLFVSFGTMTRQMRALIGRMEQRVIERTQELETRSRQLQTAAEVGRDITTRSHALVGSSGRTGPGEEMQALLDLAVRQIAASFDFYQVSLFLVENAPQTPSGSSTASGMYAELRAASGEAGLKLLQQQLRLDLTQPGVVSWAINNNQSRIIRDVNTETSYIKEPLLPDTRSEIAVPLRGSIAVQGIASGRAERVIGVLDVQSRLAGAFDQNDAATLQIIADQLANAIQNLRLIDQLNSTISELEQASGEFTRQAWQNYLQSRAAITVAGISSTSASEGMLEVDRSNTVSLPLRVRDQVIGGIDLIFEGQQTNPEVINLAEEAANRLGLVLESTRLLQEARRLALREQIIGQVAGQVRATLDIDEVMKNAIQGIGEAMEMSEVEIRLKADTTSTSGKVTAAAVLPPEDQKGATQ